MTIPVLSPSFAAGELSPSLYGRVDLSKYHIGCSTLRNLFVGLRGGAYSRAGTLFSGFSKQTGRTVPPRLITFQFSINQGIALEFGNLYTRFVIDGQFVTETATNIIGVSAANPGVITDPGHGYVNGDWVFISDLNGMTPLNGRTLIVANVTVNTYTLTDVYGNAISTVGYPPYISGGTAARIYTLTTPWAEADLVWLKWTQSADQMSICCWNQDTGTEYIPYDLTRSADDAWTLTPLNLTPGIAPPATVSGVATLTYVPGSFYPAAYSYVITAINSTGEESVASATININNSRIISETTGSEKLTWSGVAGARYYNVYKAPETIGNTSVLPYVPPGSQYGYAGTTFGTQFVDSNIVPDFQQVPPLHQNPFAPGTIQSVDVTLGGSGLTTVTWSITTATGSGFNGYPIIVNGSLSAFVVTDGGQNYLPTDAIVFNSGSFSQGTLTFGGNPGAGATITLNGVVWTFVVGAPTTNQTQIQGSLADTLSQLATDLSASANPAISVASYVQSTTVLTIQYKSPGAGGNAYTLVGGPGIVASGATLTGGSSGGGNPPAAILVVGPETGTYPSTVAYFQERRIYASTPNQPDTYFMSQPGLFKNFDSRIPTVDDDAIIGTPWSVEVNGIQFMISMPGGLVALTGLEAWQLTGAGGSSLNPQPLTPANQQAQPQAYNGCSARVPPTKIDYDIVYVQAKGSLFRDLSYNFWANIYTGTDITYLSPHLFLGMQILSTAWCEEPNRIMWATRNDGVLLSLTFFKQQEIMGWARHDTYGRFWSCCSVTEPPVDALYVAVERPFAGGDAYTIERMDNRIWAANENAWCSDAGLQTVLPQPAGTLSASSATGLGQPDGVTNLVGGANYNAATTTGVLQDPTGAGTVVTLSIVAGVVTDIGFAGGSGYTNPQLQIIDTSGLGQGASAGVSLSNAAIFTCTAPSFSAGSVGQVIRMGGGKAVVTAYNTANQVTANIIAPITQIYPNSPQAAPIPAAQGDWSLAPQTTTVAGLWHLVGSMVSILADGQPLNPQIVASNGTVTLSTAASLVTVGLGFTAQLQTLYLDAGQPTEQTKRKVIPSVNVRLEATGLSGAATGTNQTDGSTLSPPATVVDWGANGLNPLSPLTPPANENLPPYGSTIAPLFTGDIRVPVTGGYAKPAQVAIQQVDPLPLNVLAIVADFLPGDTGQASAAPPQGEERGEKRPGWGPLPARRAA